MVSNPSTEEAETSGSWSFLVSCGDVICDPIKIPCQKTRWMAPEEWHLRLNSTTHTCMYTCDMHIYVHKIKNKFRVCVLDNESGVGSSLEGN